MLEQLRDVVSYLDVPHSLTVPIWREGRVLGEALASRRMASPAPAEHPRDVLLVPGFLDDGGSLEPLAHRLEHAGHRVHRANLGRNIDCTEQMTQRLEARVADVADTVGSPLVLVGHSRGGMLAKVAAVRHPERIAAVIAVGSPLASPHDITIVLRLVKLGLRRLSRLGVPGLLDDCLFGSCCDRFYRDLASPPPAGVELISIGSPSDGMVASSATRDPDARFVTVEASHTGLVLGPAGIEAIEDVLAALAPAMAAELVR